MDVFYDTEFLERGQGFPIFPISIGLVRGDGEEYYAINRNAPWLAIAEHDWLRENVLPHLPGRWGGAMGSGRRSWQIDEKHPAVKSLLVIGNEVGHFLLDAATVDAQDPLRLWAYYCSYDHVVLAQLFGRMVDMPKFLPYYTHDLKVAQMLLAPDFRFPEQDSAEHHALDDARWVRDAKLAMDEHIARSA